MLRQTTCFAAAAAFLAAIPVSAQFVSNPASRAPNAPLPAIEMLSNPTNDFVAWPPDNQRVLDGLRLDQITLDDAQRDGQNGMPRRVGIELPVPGGRIDATEAGVWSVLPSGARIWTLRLVVADAIAVRVHFAALRLPPGTRMTLGDEHQLVTISAESADDALGVWSGLIPGQSVLLEFQDPTGLSDEPRIAIDRVAHIYRDLADPGLRFEPRTEPCEEDVNCRAHDPTARDAVGLLIFNANGGTYVCTGALLNDADPQTAIGWFLTANHCVNTQESAASVLIYWFYQTTMCNGAVPNPSTLPQSNGAVLMSHSTDTDFALLRLLQNPVNGQGLAGWTTNDPVGSVSGIHHPAGEFKRISIGALTMEPPICDPGLPTSRFWYLDWSVGITEGGSSGSPLFNANWQVIGQLFGSCFFAPSRCDNPRDWNCVYGKFGPSYPLIASYLNSPTPDDPHEENDTLASAAPLALGAHGLILADADDFFAVDVCATTTLTSTVQLRSGDATFDLFLLAANGEVLSTATGAGATKTVGAAAQPGRYVVRVARTSGTSAVYVLRLGTYGRPRQIHVMAGATGANNGTSWADAYTSLQSALTSLNCGNGQITEVWVASATYKPAAANGDRLATFQLRDGVAIYGGFAGTETQRSQRNPAANPTILSGDLNGNDGANFTNFGENSYHVVTGSGVGSSAVLDGFTISGGNANGPNSNTDKGGAVWNLAGSPTVRNCRVLNNRANYGGGGLANFGSRATFSNSQFFNNASHFGGAAINGDASMPVFLNCLFAGNSGSGSGGVADNNNADPIFVNCVFSGNRMTGGGRGGALWLVNGADATLSNCTFSRNTATVGMGGAIAMENATLAATNCIFRNNSDSGGTNEAAQVRLSGTNTVNINYCSIHGLTGGLGGVGNIGLDCVFVDDNGSDNVFGTLDDNVRLQSTSPCIDRGDSSGDTDANTPGVQPLPSVDLDQRSRQFDNPASSNLGVGPPPPIDFGAYEFGAPLMPTRLFVNVAVGGGNGSGFSWTDASPGLQAPLTIARLSFGWVMEIWAARGTYKPNGPGGDRAGTFRLVDGLSVYGGFAAGETSLDQRNIAANATILSGDLNGDDGANFSNYAENSFHVVTTGGVSATTVLDGFTLIGGNANGGTYESDKGGAVWNELGSPTIRNCTFLRNRADYAGGAIETIGGSPFVSNCAFVGNASLFGGAMSNDEPGAPWAVNCIFVGNIAFGNGGATDNNNSSPTFVNCMFSGNLITGGGKGGAVYLVSNASGRLLNCTLSRNTTGSGGRGGGICVEDAALEMGNSILRSNSDSGGTNEAAQITRLGATTPVVNYCCIQNLTGALGGAGNISSDPMFVDPDGADNVVGTLDDDLRFLVASACVDAGNNPALPPDFTLDLAGSQRRIDNLCRLDTGAGQAPIIDMGAYEGGAGLPLRLGDANGDGVVNASDAAALATLLVNASQYNAGCGGPDVNNDGVLDGEDIAPFLALIF